MQEELWQFVNIPWMNEQLDVCWPLDISEFHLDTEALAKPGNINSILPIGVSGPSMFILQLKK